MNQSNEDLRIYPHLQQMFIARHCLMRVKSEKEKAQRAETKIRLAKTAESWEENYSLARSKISNVSKEVLSFTLKNLERDLQEGSKLTAEQVAEGLSEIREDLSL